MPKKREVFKFKPGFSIGGVAAETDPFLESCFISTDCYVTISNPENPKGAIIGRAGIGKTAIVEELRREYEGNIITIDPEALAFQFLGKSDMIRALRQSGVNLDYFYKLLWRHVIVVEILKHCFPEESKRNRLLSQLIGNIKKTLRPDAGKERAIKYLDEWDASVLQTPQERIIEIHNNLNKRLRARLGFTDSWIEMFDIGAGVEGEIASSKEIIERVKIASEVISQIQVQDLNAVRDYIGGTILDDRQKPCYVLIDDLDRFWVEDYLVYEIIRGLILEIYDWKKVKNLKIVYVLRNNILNKIESEFKTRSYQKEKLEDQRYYMHWTRKELIDLVNKRLAKISWDLNYLNTPTLEDMLPRKRGRQPSGLNYIFDRILDRPRDIIDFINKAGALSIGKDRISMEALRHAEDSYSEERLKALFDEWRENYPGIEIIAKLLRGYPPRFALSLWSENDMLEIMTDRRVSGIKWMENISEEFEKNYRENINYAVSNCRRRILKLLFEIGLVGVRIGEGGTDRYCYMGSPSLSDLEIEGDPQQVVIHHAFHKALGNEPWSEK